MDYGCAAGVDIIRLQSSSHCRDDHKARLVCRPEQWHIPSSSEAFQIVLSTACTSVSRVCLSQLQLDKGDETVRYSGQAQSIQDYSVNVFAGRVAFRPDICFSPMHAYRYSGRTPGEFASRFSGISLSVYPLTLTVLQSQRAL